MMSNRHKLREPTMVSCLAAPGLNLEEERYPKIDTASVHLSEESS